MVAVEILCAKCDAFHVRDWGVLDSSFSIAAPVTAEGCPSCADEEDY